MARVDLIGIARHCLQVYLHGEKSRQDVLDLLESTCRRLTADLVAEEFSEETIQCHKKQLAELMVQRQGERSLSMADVADQTTAQIAAERLGIGHLFADPDTDARDKEGLWDSGGREDFWCRHLMACNFRHAVFVCGNTHVESFKDRLRARGFSVDVICRNWGSEFDKDEIYCDY